MYIFSIYIGYIRFLYDYIHFEITKNAHCKPYTTRAQE